MSTHKFENYVCDWCGARFQSKPEKCQCGNLKLEDL
jgi:ribosomal protein L40E